MKFLIASFLFVAVASAYPTLYLQHEDDGQYRGEGLIESQDYGQYNVQTYGSAYGYDDGQYKGEGLAESQDYGQYDNHGIYGAAIVAAPAVYAAAPVAYAHYAHGGAPIGIDGRVVDTPEVAHAKAAHFAAKASASHGVHGIVAAYAAPAAYAVAPVAPVAYAAHYVHGGAPIGHDGRVVDTPEVAHAKAAHFAAKAAAGSHY